MRHSSGIIVSNVSCRGILAGRDLLRGRNTCKPQLPQWGQPHHVLKKSPMQVQIDWWRQIRHRKDSVGATTMELAPFSGLIYPPTLLHPHTIHPIPPLPPNPFPTLLEVVSICMHSGCYHSWWQPGCAHSSSLICNCHKVVYSPRVII